MKISNESPPQIAQIVLRIVCEPSLREEMLDDMLEEFRIRQQRTGRREAVIWYWRQIWLSMASLSWFRLTSAVGPQSLCAVIAGFAVAFFAAIGMGLAARQFIFGSAIPEGELALNLVSVVCACLSSVAGSFSACWVTRRSNAPVLVAIGSFVLAPHFILKSQVFDQTAMSILLIAITVAGLATGQRLAEIWNSQKKGRA